MPVHLTHEQLSRELALRDLTDPAEGGHAVQLVVDRMVRALADLWGCAVRWCRGGRVVTIEDNYDNLGYPPEAVTRDARYTRYVDDRWMLRSHTTAMVPPALRAVAADPVADVLLVCPGIVHRRDAIDRHHTGTPHQLDLWRVVRRERAVTSADLNDMITAVLGAVLPGATDRREPRVHPYTRDGRQVDVADGNGWIEVAEGGLAHPRVLGGAGLDASWSGLALGLGLDRLLMLVKSIPDIRLLRAVPGQMTDLAPYRPVSAMPAIQRDISIAVAADDRVEDLGDRVRHALGDNADSVESVTILDETPCADLPEPARARLGAHTGQKNVLVRVVLRSHGTTLSNQDANRLRDRVYAALHQGTAWQWATGRP